MPYHTKTHLYYEVSGSSNSPSIIFLHGGGVAGWMWKKHIDSLSADYHCIVPDLPEQGNSIKAGPFSISYAADCVADLIRDLAHEGKAHVIGLSEGAQIVVSLLSRHPEVIDRAVCSSALLRPMPGQWMYTRSLFSLAYLLFVSPFKSNDRWIRLNMHESAGISDEYFQEFKRSFQQTTQSGFVNLMYCAMHFRLPAGLERVTVPVLVVTGKMEYRQMQLSAKDLLTALPNSIGRMISLGDGSSLAKEHNWPLTAPELFTLTIKSWIEGYPLPEQLIVPEE